MKLYDCLADLDLLAYEFECISGLAMALHEALENGNNEPESYGPCAYGIVAHIDRAVKDMREATSKAIACDRESRFGGTKGGDT